MKKNNSIFRLLSLLLTLSLISGALIANDTDNESSETPIQRAARLLQARRQSRSGAQTPTPAPTRRTETSARPARRRNIRTIQDIDADRADAQAAQEARDRQFAEDLQRTWGSLANAVEQAGREENRVQGTTIPGPLKRFLENIIREDRRAHREYNSDSNWLFGRPLNYAPLQADGMRYSIDRENRLTVWVALPSGLTRVFVTSDLINGIENLYEITNAGPVSRNDEITQFLQEEQNANDFAIGEKAFDRLDYDGIPESQRKTVLWAEAAGLIGQAALNIPEISALTSENAEEIKESTTMPLYGSIFHAGKAFHNAYKTHDQWGTGSGLKQLGYTINSIGAATAIREKLKRSQHAGIIEQYIRSLTPEQKKKLSKHQKLQYGLLGAELALALTAIGTKKLGLFTLVPLLKIGRNIHLNMLHKKIDKAARARAIEEEKNKPKEEPEQKLDTGTGTENTHEEKIEKDPILERVKNELLNGEKLSHDEIEYLQLLKTVKELEK